MLRAVLAEAGGTLVSVVTSSKFNLHWGILVGGSIVSFYFLSWDVAISFARSLGCGRGRLSGWDVGCTTGSWVGSGSVVLGTSSCVGSGSVVLGTSSVLLLGPASSTMRIGDLRSMR